MTFRCKVPKKGVRANLKKTRVLLSVGLVLSMAGAATAAQRSRGASVDRNHVVADSPVRMEARNVPTNIREVAPGVVKFVRNGIESTMRANGMVGLEELIAEFGSIEDWRIALATANSPTALGPFGETVTASNMIMNRSSWVGDGPMRVIQSTEDYKRYVAWAETTIGGTTMTAFINGAVGVDQAQAIVRSVPVLTGSAGEEIAADGVIRN